MSPSDWSVSVLYDDVRETSSSRSGDVPSFRKSILGLLESAWKQNPQFLIETTNIKRFVLKLDKNHN